MLVKRPGKYIATRDFSVQSLTTIRHFGKGNILTITQVDERDHKIIGEDFPDWHPWDVPVEPIER